MTNAENDDTQNDHALAHLILGVSPVAREEVGADATEEEIAILAEGRASELLGQEREQQLRAQIANSPELYSQWLMLADLIDESRADIKTGASRANVDGDRSSVLVGLRAALHRFFGSLSLPAGAAFAGLGLAFVFGAYHVGKESGTGPASGQETGQLAQSIEGQSLPEKAARSEVTTRQIDAGAREPLSVRFLCTDSETSTAAVCVSMTQSIQHWFLASDDEGYRAVQAPIEADRVIGLTINANMLLIETENAGAFRLSLFALPSDMRLDFGKPVFQDAAAGGYFENISLTASGLRYDKVLSDGTRETVRQEINRRP